MQRIKREDEEADSVIFDKKKKIKSWSEECDEDDKVEASKKKEKGKGRSQEEEEEGDDDDDDDDEEEWVAAGWDEEIGIEKGSEVRHVHIFDIDMS